MLGGPIQPGQCRQHPAHATATHACSQGRRCRVGSRVPAGPCTAIGRSRGAAAAWGAGGTQCSAPCQPPVPSRLRPQTHSWNHHRSTCSSLRSSSWWQAKSEGAQTPSSTSSRRVSLQGKRGQHGDTSPGGSWAPTDTPPPEPAWEHPPVLVLGQLLLLPGGVAPTKTLVLRPLQALGTWGGGSAGMGSPPDNTPSP